MQDYQPDRIRTHESTRDLLFRSHGSSSHGAVDTGGLSTLYPDELTFSDLLMYRGYNVYYLHDYPMLQEKHRSACVPRHNGTVLAGESDCTLARGFFKASVMSGEQTSDRNVFERKRGMLLILRHIDAFTIVVDVKARFCLTVEMAPRYSDIWWSGMKTRASLAFMAIRIDRHPSGTPESRGARGWWQASEMPYSAFSQRNNKASKKIPGVLDEWVRVHRSTGARLFAENDSEKSGVRHEPVSVALLTRRTATQRSL